jgi:hypothetical protein
VEAVAIQKKKKKNSVWSVADKGAISSIHMAIFFILRGLATPEVPLI